MPPLVPPLASRVRQSPPALPAVRQGVPRESKTPHTSLGVLHELSFQLCRSNFVFRGRSSSASWIRTPRTLTPRCSSRGRHSCVPRPRATPPNAMHLVFVQLCSIGDPLLLSFVAVLNFILRGCPTKHRHVFPSSAFQAVPTGIRFRMCLSLCGCLGLSGLTMCICCNCSRPCC